MGGKHEPVVGAAEVLVPADSLCDVGEAGLRSWVEGFGLNDEGLEGEAS